MPEFLDKISKGTSAVEHPTIRLASGHVVSFGSSKSFSPVGAIEFACHLRQPSQTGDLSVIVRDELSKNPIVVDGVPSLDGSDRYQMISDYALFFKREDCVWFAVSDLFCMYGGDWTKQLEAAKMVGWGADLPMDGEFVVRLLDTAGVRKVKMPRYHWPYKVPSEDSGGDKIVRAVFPREADRFQEYLVRMRRNICQLYLLGSRAPNLLDGGKNGAVKPMCLGGGDYGGINGVVAGGDLNIGGRARVGCVIEPKMICLGDEANP